MINIKNDIFLPKNIKVGFQNRNDTYTKQLAYIIYFDQKGKLRKEASWESWRSKNIEAMELENIPTEGFVLNKKVGGTTSGWNYRQSYVRVYDPRGFEFEITIPNLLYILENTSSIKGKGLEGEFVYGWDKQDLILIPTSSPDYKELNNFKDNLFNSEKFKLKDMIAGSTYLTKKNQEVVYLGRYSKLCYYDQKDLGKHYVFGLLNDRDTIYIEDTKSLNNLIIKLVDSECSTNYNRMLNKLKETREYDDIDRTKTEYIELSLDEFKKELIKNRRFIYTYNKHLKEWERPDINRPGLSCLDDNLDDEVIITFRTYDPYMYHSYPRGYTYSKGNYEYTYNILKPHKKQFYLRNGDLWNE